MSAHNLTGTDPSALPVFAQRAASDRPAARGLAGPTRPTHSPTTVLASSAPPAAGPSPAQVPRVTEFVNGRDLEHDPVDYTAVQQIRAAVTEAFQTDHPGSTISAADSVEEILRLIDAEISDYSSRQVLAGNGALNHEQRVAVRRAVYDSMFGVGRIQPLLDLEGLENIEIEGCDNVWLQFADGRLERGPAVADSDDQLIADIKQIARWAPSGEKDFSPVTKKLRMALPDKSRLAAEAWLSHRPSITIRKHRFVDTDLDQMIELGAVDVGLAAFLTAAIRAGKSVVVSGLAASGKTTLIRAVLNQLDPLVRLATIETNYELFLHEMPTRHYRIWAAEAQEGGEAGSDGRVPGRVTVVQLVELALQKNVDRIVVGEVVGPEILAMLEAMQGGKGSVSTMHALSAWDTVERMVTFITRERANVGTTFAARLVAQNVDLIVHLGVVDESHLPGGRKHRFVDEVLALDIKADGDDPVERERLWAPGPDGRAVATGKTPKWIDDLVRHGFDEAWMREGVQSWTAPLDLLYPNRSTR